MIKESLYEPYSIKFATLDECPKPEHKHNFFELVYIQSGTGMQCINKSRVRYCAGHLFLLTPDDCHSFEVETTTKFFFLQFNDIYIKHNSLLTENISRLEYILQNANHQPGCILKNLSDKALVKPIIEAIIRESVNRDIYNQELIHQLVNTLIIVIARNIAKYLPSQLIDFTIEKAVNILEYIQHNIYFPEKLKTIAISEHFGMSSEYLGKYFKKHANETMQSYVSKYRTRLVTHRLKFSDKRISEIAEEFGFTDESHLNKFFKKRNGSTPSAYRKMVRS